MTADLQAFEHTKAHKLRHIYRQTKLPFKQKLNHINRPRVKTLHSV